MQLNTDEENMTELFFLFFKTIFANNCAKAKLEKNYFWNKSHSQT